jgi:hypothetical protein
VHASLKRTNYNKLSTKGRDWDSAADPEEGTARGGGGTGGHGAGGALLAARGADRKCLSLT